MPVTWNEIYRLGRLARLSLSENEVDRRTDDMSVFIESVRHLNSIDTNGIEPFQSAAETADEQRLNTVAPSLSPSQAPIDTAPTNGAHFMVPRVTG
jgi:aspartyl-tRNA(Asn)/glutamyl-tRNA(Gln) amidotransferase subunit C